MNKEKNTLSKEDLNKSYSRNVFHVPSESVIGFREARQYIDYDPSFIEELGKMPGGDKIKGCIQCGTCSGSCPTSYRMDRTPRELFAMVRAGLKEEVLSSNTPWICASCYSCAVRCPKEIKITDVMYALKRMAIRYNSIPKGLKAHKVAREFQRTVRFFGRNYEVGMLSSYFLFVKPSMLPGMIPKGIKLFFRGRMPLLPKRIKGMDSLRKIMDKASGKQGGK